MLIFVASCNLGNEMHEEAYFLREQQYLGDFYKSKFSAYCLPCGLNRHPTNPEMSSFQSSMNRSFPIIYPLDCAFTQNCQDLHYNVIHCICHSRGIYCDNRNERTKQGILSSSTYHYCRLPSMFLPD